VARTPVAAAPATAPSPVSAAAPAPPSSPYPATERRAVTDHYGDLEVVDDYRWLEAASDPAVVAWTAAQNQRTRGRLDALPDRDKLRARITELLSSKAPSYHAVTAVGAGVFALKRQPPKQQALLVAFRDPASAATERVVLDPNELDPSGKTAIDFYVPSRDGKRVAVSLSLGGSESGDLHLYDAATGAPLPDVIPQVHRGTAGGSMAWNRDATGFWYTRYPKAGERPAADLNFYQQLYFHKLGTPVADDAYALGKDLPRIAEIALKASPDGRAALVTVGNGDGGEYAFYAIDTAGGAKAPVTQLFRFDDKMVEGAFAPDGTLYFISHRGAPRGAIVRLTRPYAASRPALVVPQSDGVIVEIAATASRLYSVELFGGPSRMRSFRITGATLGSPEVIQGASPVSSMFAPRPIGEDLLYLTTSYTAAPGWFRYAPATGRSAPTALIQPMAFAMDDVEAVRETCTSADGTAIPMTVIRKRGIALDGSHPTMLTGYGGFNIGLSPGLHPLARLWVDQGGVFAEANLRGGNEFGDVWHDAGKLTHKQNVFDDFYACERAVVDHGYTRPEHLAIIGGSNGGLLMGATLVQHPEMARVVVSRVGIYDMLRLELSPNGAFNVTEFGSVTDPEQLHALFAYSPYHHVVDHTAYPAVLFTTGAHDPRVDPYNSRKMTARLQAASSSDRPILLRASDDVGHGIGSPLAAVIDENADIYAFIMSELGMPFTEPR
jgi:prolyl oligopeptidase